MGPSIYKLLGILGSTAVLAASGFASPLNSKLLSLVPSGAEIVAGFENHPAGNRPGRLVLSTHNDRLDLDDWQALAGVDSKRVIDEVIEVAAASSTGMLAEHLLLVSGHFDKERIFNAAELNGTGRSEYQGETIMLIKPFAREQGEMLDTRWLVILNNRIAMLGTQSMVQRALYRYTTHADIDMPLMERLSQLRPDVTSWNVLLVSSMTNGSAIIKQKNSLLTRLIDGAEVLMVGARFGPKIRVDFSLHAGSNRETAFFTQKAASFAEVFAKAPPAPSDSSLRAPRHLGNLSFEPNRIYGSIELSDREFQEWNQQGGFARPLQGPALRPAAHGE
jgi:hypothetical protein